MASTSVSKFVRLSKLLSNTGFCSRKQTDKLINSGRVSVVGYNRDELNGAIKIEDSSKVTLDGLPLPFGKNRIVQKTSDENKYVEVPRLFICNKISEELVSTQAGNTQKFDKKRRVWIFDRLSGKINTILFNNTELSKHFTYYEYVERLKPVLRLDYMTEGLQLFSNNGKLSRALIKSNSNSNSPNEPTQITYKIKFHGLVTESKLKGLKKGLIIDDKKYIPMDIGTHLLTYSLTHLAFVDKHKSLGATTNHWITVTIKEPAYNMKLIKYALSKVYWKVSRVICLSFGSFSLQDAPPGSFFEVKLSPNVLTLMRNAK